MDTKRLFVSIDLPLALAQLLANLDPRIAGVRWLRPDQMHLTLSFLGNVPADNQVSLMRQLEELTWKAFFLPVIGLGKFPTKGPPSVIWIGVGNARPHLFQLHKRVQEAAIAARLEPDLRAFHPHVTLGRCRDVSEQSVQAFLKSNAGFDAGMIHVQSFSLNSSALSSSGSTYTKELVCRCHRIG